MLGRSLYQRTSTSHSPPRSSMILSWLAPANSLLHSQYAMKPHRDQNKISMLNVDEGRLYLLQALLIHCLHNDDNYEVLTNLHPNQRGTSGFSFLFFWTSNTTHHFAQITVVKR
ncbi:hypothetical protein BDN72DRAFT_612970 [Pluteus cervinus]|uniref:Uncharacterized protein n=1 Tax=Pluteus cervinus TaxID=181527 RepID=A0ACD3A0T9_9AGAR|nr:hypothetical protein BDN72DRAFT_612970 [Pluteus cervinus]